MGLPIPDEEDSSGDEEDEEDSNRGEGDKECQEAHSDNRYSYERDEILEENLSQRDDHNRKVSSEYELSTLEIKCFLSMLSALYHC